MNYPFAEAALAWIGHDEMKIPASELDRRLAELRAAYPPEVTAAHAESRGQSRHGPAGLEDLQSGSRRSTREIVNRVIRPTTDRQAVGRLLPPGTALRPPADDLRGGADDLLRRRSGHVGLRRPQQSKADALEGPRAVRRSRGRVASTPEHLAFYRERDRPPSIGHAALRAGEIPNRARGRRRGIVWVFVREDADEDVLVALNASATRLTRARSSRGRLDPGVRRSGHTELSGRATGDRDAVVRPDFRNLRTSVGPPPMTDSRPRLEPDATRPNVGRHVILSAGNAAGP